MDYLILGALQQLVYREKITDTDHLKQVLNSYGDLTSQELINGVIDLWSFVFVVGIFSIISINFEVLYLLQTVFLLWFCLEIVAIIDVFNVD